MSIAAQIVDPHSRLSSARSWSSTPSTWPRRRRAQSAIPQLEGELVGYQRELEDYRATLSYIE